MRDYQFLKNNYYKLNVQFNKTNTYIQMRVLCGIYSTSKLPNTLKLLNKNLPSINNSLCFNDLKLPFNIEVKNTEIGHLFEHILLENICKFKFLYENSNSKIKGETNWNWQKDPVGLFHISITPILKDKKIFFLALSESLKLIDKILAK